MRMITIATLAVLLGVVSCEPQPWLHHLGWGTAPPAAHTTGRPATLPYKLDKWGIPSVEIHHNAHSKSWWDHWFATHTEAPITQKPKYIMHGRFLHKREAWGNFPGFTGWRSPSPVREQHTPPRRPQRPRTTGRPAKPQIPDEHSWWAKHHPFAMATARPMRFTTGRTIKHVDHFTKRPFVNGKAPLFMGKHPFPFMGKGTPSKPAFINIFGGKIPLPFGKGTPGKPRGTRRPRPSYTKRPRTTGRPAMGKHPFPFMGKGTPGKPAFIPNIFGAKIPLPFGKGTPGKPRGTRRPRKGRKGRKGPKRGKRPRREAWSHFPGFTGWRSPSPVREQHTPPRPRPSYTKRPRTTGRPAKPQMPDEHSWWAMHHPFAMATARPMRFTTGRTIKHVDHFTTGRPFVNGKAPLFMGKHPFPFMMGKGTPGRPRGTKRPRKGRKGRKGPKRGGRPKREAWSHFPGFTGWRSPSPIREQHTPPRRPRPTKRPFVMATARPMRFTTGRWSKHVDHEFTTGRPKPVIPDEHSWWASHRPKYTKRPRYTTGRPTYTTGRPRVTHSFHGRFPDEHAWFASRRPKYTKRPRFTTRAPRFTTGRPFVNGKAPLFMGKHPFPFMMKPHTPPAWLMSKFKGKGTPGKPRYTTRGPIFTKRPFVNGKAPLFMGKHPFPFMGKHPFPFMGKHPFPFMGKAKGTPGRPVPKLPFGLPFFGTGKPAPRGTGAPPTAAIGDRIIDILGVTVRPGTPANGTKRPKRFAKKKFGRGKRKGMWWKKRFGKKN